MPLCKGNNFADKQNWMRIAKTTLACSIASCTTERVSSSIEQTVHPVVG
jgi:hypothetical protein